MRLVWAWIVMLKDVFCLIYGVGLAALWYVIRYLLSMLPFHKKSVDVGPLPPGNMGFPLIGETVEYLRKSQSGEFFKERYAKYGPIFRTNFLGMNNIHIREVSHVKKVLLGEHHLVAVCWPPAMRQLLGVGSLATTLDPDHRQMRKCIRPCMNNEVMSSLRQVMVRCIAEELAKWKSQTCINLYNAAKCLTMKCACAVLIGEEGLDDDVIDDLSTNFIRFGDGFFQLPVAIPGSKYYQAVEAKKNILQITKKLQHMNSQKESVFDQIYKAMQGDVMKSQTDKDNLMVELLFGAQETTACTITCAMTLLKKNCHVLKKLHDEINHIFLEEKQQNDDITAWILCKDVRILTYLTSVINETLRLFPPIGGGFRKVLRPFVLGEYMVPKDWTITYSIQCMHDDSDLDNVADFIPERWASVVQSSYISDFLPFGAGPRSCVGKDYALQFIRLTLIMLVSTCNWELQTKDPSFTRVPIVKPKKPIMVEIQSIDSE